MQPRTKNKFDLVSQKSFIPIFVGAVFCLTGCANDPDKKTSSSSESKLAASEESNSSSNNDIGSKTDIKSKTKSGKKSKFAKTSAVPSPSKILNDLKEVKAIKNPYGYYPEPKTPDEVKASEFIAKALKIIKTGDYTKAEELSNNAKLIAPEYARVWNLVGTLEYAKTHYEEAGTAFYRACKLDTNYAAAWVNLSSVYMAQDRTTAAAQVYRHLLKLAPNEPSSWAMMGMAYTEMKDGKKAEESYKKALSLDPRNAETIFNLAYCLHCQKKYKEAEALYKKSLKLNPKNRMAWLYLSLAQTKLNKPKEASKSRKKMAKLGTTTMLTPSGKLKEADSKNLASFYNKMIEENPKDPTGYKNLAIVCINQHSFQEALPLLERANRLKPNDPKIVTLLAQTLLATDDTNRAISLMLKSLEKNKKDYSNTFLLSYTFYRQKDYANAEKYAKLAIKLEPRSEAAWSMLCDSLLPQQKFAEEVTAAKRLISLNPSVSSGIWCILIHGLLNQRKFSEAQKALTKASLIYPNDYRVLKSYGVYYGLQNNVEKAEHYFKKAVKINPGGGKCWYQLATLYNATEDQENYKKALVKTAIATNDTAGINYRDLANKLDACGKPKEATLALKKAADSVPDHNEWMTMTRTPGQDRHFPVSLRGVD